MSANYKFILIILFIISCNAYNVKAQIKPEGTDSFFLAKKKGILGKIGQSISISGEYVEPVKTVKNYKRYQGKFIRTISIVPVGFNYDLNSTSPIRNTLPIKIANGIHRNTYNKVIRKNLFFKEGQPFYPLVVADNERFLREQVFLSDARIEVMSSVVSKDSVDIIVLTRDVFSIGGSLNISSLDRIKVEVKEENIGGTGNRFALYGLYDKNRNPSKGYGAEYISRNIKGSFINWSTGFKSFNPAFNSGRPEEINIYSVIDKPMASRYTAITGAAELSIHSTINGYLIDSVYGRYFRYRFINSDIWAGYNFGHNSGKKNDSENRLRHFLALRGFYNIFTQVPAKYITEYNYRYADINGGLASYSLYRQNFYRTNFIYGFGRNEDVPEGLNATIIGGYINKQGIRRAYYGLEIDASKFNRKGSFFSYTLKTGAFVNKKSFQDINVLVGLNHFTKLQTLNKFWYNRNYMSISYTRQINPFLNEPLFIESVYGLPYFRHSLIEGDMRTTFNLESVFYNMKKIAGFRFAPFVFTGFSSIQPLNTSLQKNNGYTALGGGIRTRNENLVFGTIELRGYFFPRVMDGMVNWKVDLTTKLQFKYNSSFIRRPDFVLPN
jgi:hypothetical protein